MLSNLALIFVPLLAAVGCGDDASSSGTTPDPFVPAAYGEWLKFEPEGAECIRDNYPAVYLHLDELEQLTAATEPLGVVNGDVPVELAYPLLSANTDINPMGDWNRVFIPYCTGDTYLGSRVNTYVDPDGVGSLNNYPFIRNGIEGVDQSYLLADSGPIVPATLLDGQPSNQGVFSPR
jgi:hypothetical protein